MSYSSPLGSSVTNTKMRTPDHLSDFSGMCSVCTANCTGTCEIGLSAVRGSEAIYPYATDVNQFASEKDYPLDFSHFNINGHVFGAQGCVADANLATFPHARIGTTMGRTNKVKLLAPIVLPAMAKLNWRDYYAGAALAGVLVVIGEDVVAKDKGLVLDKGRVIAAPLIEEMVAAFRAHERGYGDIILQANYDDEQLGVLEYALEHLPVTSVELKFGQAAKGIQGMGRVSDIDQAIKFQQMGYIVHPDPSDPQVAANYRAGKGPVFEKIGKLPMWDEVGLIERVAELRRLGAKRVCFKTGPYAPLDLVKIFRIAAKAGVDMVTVDGAGGGSGNSPVKMMNEWGVPTVNLECMVYRILHQLQAKGYELPQVVIAGGFAMEDHVFKGLALGAPYIGLVGIGRAAMAAATVGRQIGELIEQGKTPPALTRFGNTIEEIFDDFKVLKGIYGADIDGITPGAIAVYSYLHRVSVGLQQLMALNRKFSLDQITQDDIVPLTDLAAQVSGLPTYEKMLQTALAKI